MDDPRELLIAWLEEARCLETAQIPLLEARARVPGIPRTLKEKIDRHIAETRQHRESMKSCIVRLGGSPSPEKDGAPGNPGPAGSLAASGLDAGVASCISGFAAESFEIACYRALMQAAEETGNLDIAAVCREILRQEEDMARSIENGIPAVVRALLQPLTTAP
jgi:ferritin-like metal-binding protein YciE